MIILALCDKDLELSISHNFTYNLQRKKLNFGVTSYVRARGRNDERHVENKHPCIEKHMLNDVIWVKSAVFDWM